LERKVNILGESRHTKNAVKNVAEQIFEELGLTMTAAAIEEGRAMVGEPFQKGYNSIEELRKALDI